ncbi:PKD repeat protein [Friedmanniella endophytica]|uniref:PKD repeat protein n=1 Tax=Microlunatus kandeliicorticis TaxID=1759536 RepID=A0A7W3IP54_9ACTN|nr:PKD domain-containing protein [Microlunatus kandeliicorticis]MBA8792666.1 PKD repeat protein [Microlunatus kandeliicorticis]
MISRPTGAVTADALPTVQIDGVVWDQAIVGNTVYAGGQFTTARPAGAAAGTNTTPRSNLLAYDITTGNLITSFAPTVNGRVRTVAVSPDGSKLYIGGSFTSVNGVSRYRIAAFNTATGALISSFAPTVGSDVFSITVTNNAVYLGGWFTTVNGVARTRLAAVDPTSGALLGWAPTADNTVYSLAASGDGSKVIVGGSFANVNGSFSPGIASLDGTTGTSLPFAANSLIQNYGDSAGSYSVRVTGNVVTVTGFWFGGTGNFEGVYAADLNTGTIQMMADCHGDTYDSTVMNNVVYLVSHEHDCSNVGGFPDTNPRNRWQRANAWTLAAAGTVQPNTAGGYYNFAGQPAPSLINWFPDVASGTYTGQSQGGWTTESNGSYVIEGGEFPTVNGTAQQGLVRFAVPSIAPNKQGPRATKVESTPTLRAVGDTSMRISWLTNYDRDDQVLTYKVYRSGTAAPIYTTTATSQFWNRPTLNFTDTGLTKGKAYTYSITASDASGNTSTSNQATATAGVNAVDQSPYSQAVIADGASNYWRLDEATGVTTSTDWAGGNDLTLSSGVTNGKAGAISGSTDTAAGFDGTANGVAVGRNPQTAPDTFSAEAWFNTTTTSGGKILGFGSSSTTANSGSYDRHVYMDNAGHLVFGVYPGSVQVLTTSKTYNDGSWHHVVAELSPAGMRLYVDGLAAGAKSNVTNGQAYTGYWRVGGDNLGGWPNQPSSANFAGTIDDVAIYPSALSLTQVRDHYLKSGRSLGGTAPTDGYGKAVYADNPDLFWRLDETSGSTAADASPNGNSGVLSGGFTQGVSSPVTTAGKAVTFNGSNGTIGSSQQVSDPSVYSEELWFNTTTTHGGKLIGFGDRQSGTSGNYDRHVYMENSGQLTFGVWTGQTNLITSPKSYNDGSWHYLVATQGADGMKLYVDGQLVGTNPQTDQQAYAGYWRVGGDSDWGGDSPFFAGTIDEVAVYSGVLTAAQISAHYAASPAGQPAPNQPPTAAFSQTCSQGACSFDASASTDPDGTVASYAWDFGDQSTGTGAKPSHTYTASGTYTVKLTVTDDQGATDTETAQVTVTVPAPNQAPTAAFTSSTQNLAATFDGTGSSDPDGTVASYAWDFGDQSTGTGAKPSHTYTAAGTYTVKLTVTDDQGATDSVTHTVTVSAANQPPTASFTATTTGLSVAVDASASSDPDGTVAGYAWDFGDNGTDTGKTTSHTYAAAGTYTVKLTVTDNQGATTTVSKSVTVAAASPVIAADTFTRTQTKWGTADTGGSWTLSAGTPFSTDGASGLINLASAGTGPSASLGSVSAADVRFDSQFSLSKVATGGGVYYYVDARKTSQGNYRASVQVTSSGAAVLSLRKVVNGTETTLKSATVSGLTVSANTVLDVRFEVSGSTLGARVWKDGSTMPASAQVTATDTTLTSPGSVGLATYLSGSATNAPLVVKVDNVSVTKPN